VRISQAELAGYLNLTRQGMNGLLRGLQRDGIVELGRGRLVIRDPDRLLRISTR